jgi:DnaJ-class molecular chaperone
MRCHGSGYYVEHDEDLCPCCRGSGRRDG